MSDAEDYDLERLPGSPWICETVAEFLNEKRKRITQIQWPPGTTFECKQCGDCCTWNFILMVTDEELNNSLRERAKYPHGSWVMKEERVISLQMPGYSFTGNIPHDQNEYIMKTGRHWGYWVLNARGRIALYNPTPCIHLGEDNLCAIYDEAEMTRPRACKVYFCRRHPVFGAEHYDYIFEHRKDKYRCPPEASPYYLLWTAVLGLIKEPVKILDVGCGPGQFAELCARAGHEYIGLDWSQVAIEAGREGPGEFHLVDVIQSENRTHFKEDYDVATFVEFLEHVPNDLEILADVPQGRAVILTVPDYGGREHFRFFKDLEEVTQRYRPLIAVNYRMILSGEDKEGTPIQVFILRGIRR